MADLIGLPFGILTDEIDATTYNERLQYVPQKRADDSCNQGRP